MIRRRALAVVATALAAALLGACGTSGPASSTATTVAPPSTVATTSATGHSSHPLSTAPGDHYETVRVGGLTRSFILHVPPLPTVANRPLILVYHGADDTAANTIHETDFEKVANANGELVAFLQGYDDTWNEGAGHTPAEQAHVSDVAFTSAVIADVESLASFDHARIAATGFSNGALMVEYLGCRLSKSLALIVPVEGELPTSVSAECSPTRSLRVYEIHATADGSIPYNGGSFAGVGGGTTVLSAPKSVARWAALDHCSLAPTTTHLSGGVKLTRYQRCRSKVLVTLRTIEGGSHEWGSNVGQLVKAALPS